MSLARKLELRNQCAMPAAAAPSAPCAGQRSILPAPQRLPLPAPATAPPTAPTPAQVSVEGRPVKRLSQTEMEERRRLGLCFNCNKRFARGHNRVCQRLFLVDLAEDDDAAAAAMAPAMEDAPQISLHAIAGVHMDETMQVHLRLGDSTLLALLDSGSTHSFIAEDVARRTSLQLQPRGALRVTVANGERVPCPGIYRAAPFTIDDEAFAADFYALPLAGYDTVLGTHWMASLGPILWDFSALTMSFWHRDHKVCWQGNAGPKGPALRVCSGDDMLQAML